MNSSLGITQAQMTIGSQKPTALSETGAKQLNQDQIKKAAQDVEAFFISMVFESMFAGVKTDSQFGGGQGEEVFRSMLFQEYGKATAKAGGFGIADSVQREILRLQEAQ